jgi:hypothetical protein
MRVALGLACLAVLVTGCGSKKRQRRTGDAGALVEPITPPIIVDGAVAKGGSEETEPNDTPDTAMELALGRSIHARIDPEADIDAYRIEIAGPGVLAIEVSAVQQTDLILELHDAGGTVIARSDRQLPNVKEGIPNFGVTKGRYTAIVKGRKVLIKGKPIKPPPPVLPYDISAQLVTPPPNAEKEPDDDRGTANDLIVGDPVTGYIGWTGDADVWKLSTEALSANNVLDIEITAVENTALVLEIADALGQSLLVRKAPKGVALIVRGLVPKIAAGAPPYYYLTIKASVSNPESPYSLRVVAKNPDSTDAEVEPNDTVEKPMSIPADRTIVQATWTPGDIDCFLVAPEANPRTVEAIVETPGEADFGIELLVDGKVVAKSDAKGKGVAEKVSGQVPANAKAVVRVHGADSGKEGSYELKVSEGPSK